MRHGYPRILLLLAASVVAATCCAQDQPSLGDVARQARQKKQQQSREAQSADSQGKPATIKPARVITEEEMPEHTADASASSSDSKTTDEVPSATEAKLPAAEWHTKIQAQKSVVDSLEKNIDDLNKSIEFAPGNCVAGCVEWNQHQKEKQQEVERMKGQLDVAKKQLEQMQDAARQQGYGSSVYEP